MGKRRVNNKMGRMAGISGLLAWPQPLLSVQRLQPNGLDCLQTASTAVRGPPARRASRAAPGVRLPPPNADSPRAEFWARFPLACRGPSGILGSKRTEDEGVRG